MLNAVNSQEAIRPLKHCHWRHCSREGPHAVSLILSVTSRRRQQPYNWVPRNDLDDDQPLPFIHLSLNVNWTCTAFTKTTTLFMTHNITNINLLTFWICLTEQEDIWTVVRSHDFSKNLDCLLLYCTKCQYKYRTDFFSWQKMTQYHYFSGFFLSLP